MNGSRFAHVFNQLRASYWFIPGVMALASVFAAIAMGFIDVAADQWWAERNSVALATTADGARTLLSAIAGSMITVAGVVFSMTIVAVSFAAGQFGPRLIGNFMRDAGNQVSLGVFIATFSYCMVVLRMVRSGEAEREFVPQTAILGALVLAATCIAVLIYFIHHIPETINVGNITANLGGRLWADVDTMFPTQIGEPPPDLETPAMLEAQQRRFAGGPVVDSRAHGYVVAVSGNALVKLATELNLEVWLRALPGDFVVPDDPFVQLLPGTRLDDEAIERIRACFSLARERTAEQNLLFVIDELVEILARALSPGVNDPFTAISCMRWLRSGLEAMMARQPVSALRHDCHGALRVVSVPLSLERFAARVFDQTRQYISTDRNATLAMMGELEHAHRAATNAAHRDLIIRHAEALADAAQDRLPIATDRHAVRERFAALSPADVGDTHPTDRRA